MSRPVAVIGGGLIGCAAAYERGGRTPDRPRRVALWRAVPGARAGEREAISGGDEAGLYVATAHCRNGILLAPITAALLTECMTTGQTPAVLAPFLPGRFLRKEP